MNQNEDYFTVGWVQDAQGIRGECFVRFYTQNPEWILDVNELKLIEVTRDCKDRLKKKSSQKNIMTDEIIKSDQLNIDKIKAHKNGYRIKFSNIKDRNQAEALKGFMVQVATDVLNNNLDEGEFYFDKILGFEVKGTHGQVYGTVSSHYSNGAHDILVLKNNFPGKEIPFVDDFIDNIDFENKLIIMKLPEGLLEL